MTGGLFAWQGWIAQPHHEHIQSVTHHSVSARTHRRCLQLSGLSTRRPLLRLPLTGSVCAANGAMNGGRGQRNGTTLYLLTNRTSACNITMVGFTFGDTGPVLHLLGVGACGPPIDSALAISHIPTGPPLAHPIELLLVLAINRKRVIHEGITTGLRYTPHCYTNLIWIICKSRMYP
ncbi:HTH_38 domain-containing protein [Trichonephila clavipes]|nr:HTH_38 domain-containing protein [Trichonephila clavipes]